MDRGSYSPSRSSLAQGDIITFPFRNQIPDWEEINNRTLILIIRAKISYRDIFMKPHLTPICFYYSVGGNAR